jgi:glycosyltransferase involved in cell wall biosynthesis
VKSLPSKRSAGALSVAHVISTPTGVGGAERTLSDLVAHGGRLGHRTLVLNPFALDPGAAEARDLYAPATYEGHRCATWRELPTLRRWLARRLVQFEPDIVHAHLFHASVLVASIRRPGNARLLLSHQHGDHLMVTRARLREQIDRAAGRRFDHVVGCSQSVEDYLLYRYGYPPARVSHVHNGWSGDPEPRSADLTGHDLICVARLRAQKNHRVLIDALVHVRKEIPDVRLLLVGDGEQRTAIEEQIRRCGLADCVELLGSVDNVWPLLARAHVFVLPSAYEPLGISVLEAMAAGLPVVASAVGGLREIVEDAVTGRLVPPGDANALSLALIELLRDRETASEMGRRGREAAEHYRVQRTLDRYRLHYDRLLAAGPARRDR